MFEFSVARKYLAPRWRQLSVSIISLISILVIALVVWLIVVFFSVTNGLEKGWVQKLIALTAPVRMTPTQAYYDSYYYLVDGISADSDYTLKSIGEKLHAENTNPYDAGSDEEIPLYWQQPVLDRDGNIKDIVKETFSLIQNIPGFAGLKARDYEVTMGNLRLRLLRQAPNGPIHQKTQAFLNQATYLGSIDHDNPSLSHALLPITSADLNNYFEMLSENDEEAGSFQDRLKAFLETATIQELKTPENGWAIPKAMYPKNAKVQVLAVTQNNRLAKVIVPIDAKNLKSHTQNDENDVEIKDLEIINHVAYIDQKQVPFQIPIVIEGGTSIPAEIDTDSISQALHITDLKFKAALKIQEQTFAGLIPFRNLELGHVELSKQSELFGISHSNEAVLLPKTFRGVLVGDKGYISYYSPTASSIQEQRLPIYVSGFYDPGIIPIGGKFVLANPEVVNLIRTSHNQDEASFTNGINVRFDNIEDAPKVKAALQKALKEAGLDAYWQVETYREFDFTKDLLQQLQSDKTLFTLISTIIILVACSNIISMLIILVNDKKVEIGILRSMGASFWSIGLIFGTCGVVMGVMGSLIGTIAALITLKNLDVLITFLSKIQGHNAFNPMFYGETLPNEVSFEALLFVIGATALISLIAGIVPAIKASMLRPSTILRSE